MRSMLVLLAACSSPPASPAIANVAGDTHVPLPGTWLPVTGAPGSVQVRVASAPATSVPPLAWRACRSARAGCAAWTAPGPAGDRSRFMPTGVEPVFEDAAGVHLSYVRRDDGAAHSLAIIQLLDGPAEAAWWSPDGDALLVATASRHGIAARMIMPGDETPPHYLGGAALAAAPKLTLAPASLDAAAPLSQNAARGDDFIALEAMGMSGDVRAAAFSLTEPAFSGGQRDDVPLISPLPISDGYLAVIDAAESGVVHVGRDGSRRVLARPHGSARITVAAVDRTSETVVWIEESLDDVGPPTLWTGKRQIASIATRGSIVANAGVVAYVVDGARARIVRIADGRTWDLAGEAELPFVAPLWVNATAAWFLVSDRPGGGIAGIVRVAR